MIVAAGLRLRQALAMASAILSRLNRSLCDAFHTEVLSLAVSLYSIHRAIVPPGELEAHMWRPTRQVQQPRPCVPSRIL